MNNTTRRQLLRGLAGSALMLAVRPLRAQLVAVPEPVAARYGQRPIAFERVVINLPPLAENGNSVPIEVRVDSPMTLTDYIRRIDVFAPANPVPHLIGFDLSPAAGQARVESRIRLADSQQIWVVCEDQDGQLFGALAEVVVTLAACLDSFL
ncbi:MAG: thiosulfate oxidation carrier protein SoxY [Pseudomonadota bacterium]